MFVHMQVKSAPGILELPCDVLIPAALETQIHSGNAGNIKVPRELQSCFLFSSSVVSFSSSVVSFYDIHCDTCVIRDLPVLYHPLDSKRRWT